VHVVGLDGQLQDLPTFLGTLEADVGLALPSELPREEWLASLGTPDQGINNQVDTVLMALVVHVVRIYINDTEINRLVVPPGVLTVLHGKAVIL
jgi:hypothetical protein